MPDLRPGLNYLTPDIPWPESGSVNTLCLKSVVVQFPDDDIAALRFDKLKLIYSPS